MPDHMAKRVIDSVSKKPVSPEDELQKALDEIARDIALIEPDPQDWGWWVNICWNSWRRKPRGGG